MKKSDLIKENEGLRTTVSDLLGRLDARNTAFNTMAFDLTHAKVQRDIARTQAKRLKLENKRLRNTLNCVYGDSGGVVKAAEQHYREKCQIERELKLHSRLLTVEQEIKTLKLALRETLKVYDSCDWIGFGEDRELIDKARELL